MRTGQSAEKGTRNTVRFLKTNRVHRDLYLLAPNHECTGGIRKRHGYDLAIRTAETNSAGDASSACEVAPAFDVTGTLNYVLTGEIGLSNSATADQAPFPGGSILFERLDGGGETLLDSTLQTNGTDQRTVDVEKDGTLTDGRYRVFFQSKQETNAPVGELSSSYVLFMRLETPPAVPLPTALQMAGPILLGFGVFQIMRRHCRSFHGIAKT